MELRHLRYFLAVADSGSLTKAADIVHVTQPALSRQIKDLEDELNVRLFVRNSNGVTLTEAGTVFRAHCISILKQTESAKRDVGDHSISPRVLLRIAFDQLSGSSYLIRALHALGTRADNIDVNVTEQSERAILQHLFAGTLDLGLWTGDLNKLPPEFASVAVAKRSASILFADDGQLGKDAQFRLDRLRSLPLVVLSDVAKSQHHEFAMDVSRRVNMLPTSMIYAPDRMTMYSLIAARRGFSFILDDPDLDMFDGALSRFSIPLGGDSTHTYAIWPKMTNLLARDLFVQILHEMVDHSGLDSAAISHPVYSTE